MLLAGWYCWYLNRLLKRQIDKSILSQLTPTNEFLTLNGKMSDLTDPEGENYS